MMEAVWGMDSDDLSRYAGFDSMSGMTMNR